MKIQDYVRILRQRGWIIVLVAALTAASAFIFSRFQTPVYRASVQVSIQMARPDYGLTQTAKLLLRSYANYIWSEQQAQKVIDALALVRSPGDLKSKVKIQADDGLLVIQIDVDDYDGEQAKSIANTWAQLLVDWRNEQNARQNKEDRVYAAVIDPAKYALLRPKASINLAAGGAFGLVIGIAVVAVLEWLEAGIVTRPQDLEQTLGLTIIGIIPPTG